MSVTLGSSGVFSVNVVYKYMDTDAGNTEHNLSAVFSGTETLSNFVAGSSNDIEISVANWSVDATHAGVPTYMNDVYDYDEVIYRIKNNSGSVIKTGLIPLNYSTSTFNNSARTGTVNTNIVDTNFNSLSNEPHTLEIVLVYKNNATP